MKHPVKYLLFLMIGSLGLVSLPLEAQQLGSGRPVEMLRSNVVISTEEEAQDAQEMAALINKALSIRRDVIITLHNETSIIVGAAVTVQRYWLTVPLQDRSEIRFRASMIASLKIK